MVLIIIDVCCFENCLQEKRIAEEIDDIEKDTGFKLRILAQNYPVTPGNVDAFSDLHMLFLLAL